MQEPRRRRRLQFYVLSVVVATACGPASSSRGPTADSHRLSVATAQPVAAAQLAATFEPAPETAPATLPPAPASSCTSTPGQAPVPAPPPELPVGTKVLQIGDSFADALGKDLGKLLRGAGLRAWLETKTPSYIGDWAYGTTLPKLLSHYRPDLVLVTLGANELEIPEPAQRVVPVQRLAGRLAQQPCVWILPPLWKADTGVIQVIRDHAAPCRVLDSSQLVRALPRGPDRIHPNAEGRARWAGAVFDWLAQARQPAGPLPWSLR